MRKTIGQIVYLAVIILLSSHFLWGQQWEELRFEYTKWEPERYRDFQGSIKYGVYYEVDGKRAWITRYSRSVAGRDEQLIDFTGLKGRGRLVLALKDLVWGDESHNSYSNFIIIHPGQETLLSEGFAAPADKRLIIRNPDLPSAALSFPFDPARISRHDDGTVYGRMEVRLLVHVDGKDLPKKLLDFEYKLKFSPSEEWEAGRDTFFPRSVEEAPLAGESAVRVVPDPPPAPEPDAGPVPLPVPAELAGSAIFSIAAVPANDEAGEVAISIRHERARRVGEFMLYFRKRINPGGRWAEVPYQNYRLQNLEDRQRGGDDAFRFTYRDFSPGEYLVLAARGEERDSATFRVDPGSQRAAAVFTQDGGLVHLRIRGGQPPFLLQYRSEGDTGWSTAPLNEQLYQDPLLTYFENLQDKIDAFQKNGAYDIRILSPGGVPVVDQASLVIDRPWGGWRTLGWMAATLALVGIFAFLRHLWWKNRTFYE